MTANEFRETIFALGLNQKQAAMMLGYGAATRVSELATGVRPVPMAVERLLHAYADGYRPSDWPGE